ncbi:MAG: acyl-CoA thioesterase [Rhizobiales bacterium]|nr:acyl-CoA thioesterase [Hyphomicrobiales bacterium]
MLSNTRIMRIEWADCDPAGIVFYPRYFEMFDLSTTMLFEKALGMKKINFIKAHNFGGYPMFDTRARFFKPTTFGDVVEIASSVTFGRTSFDVEHRLTRDGELCVEGFEKRVWVIRDPSDPTKIKSHPIPREVIEKFEM